MLRTQIYLSDAERQGLQSLALRSGRSQSVLIREAIDSFLERHQPHARLARLRQARGLWAPSRAGKQPGGARRLREGPIRRRASMGRSDGHCSAGARCGC